MNYIHMEKRGQVTVSLPRGGRWKMWNDVARHCGRVWVVQTISCNHGGEAVGPLRSFRALQRH